MTHEEQALPDRPQLTLVHSLPKGALPPEFSDVEAAPLYSVDNPNRIPAIATLEPPIVPVPAFPGQAEGKVIDARETFEEAQRRAREAAAGANRPLHKKVSNFLGRITGPYF